ncbi:Large ribosomal subunit protein [Trichinella pseudospiralis]
MNLENWRSFVCDRLCVMTKFYCQPVDANIFQTSLFTSTAPRHFHKFTKVLGMKEKFEFELPAEIDLPFSPFRSSACIDSFPCTH